MAGITLPLELLGAILEHSDATALCAAARASHALRREAERHLYRAVALKQAGRGAELLHALRRCPERARYVRSLAVFDYDVSRADFSALLMMLGSLEVLDVHACAEGIEPRVDDYPFRGGLRELEVHADCDELPPDAFVRLLGPRLASLKMPLSRDTARHAALCERALSEAEPDFLPGLQTLHAPVSVLLAFLRARGKRTGALHLQHLGVPTTTVLSADSELWRAIAASGCDIRSLAGVRTGEGYAVLKAMATACPRVESLELALHCVDSFGFELVFHEIYGRPPILSHLRSLTLNAVQGPGSMRPVNARMRYNLRSGLLMCFPRLELLNGYAVSLPRTFDM